MSLLRVGVTSVLVLDDNRFQQQVMRIILNGLGVKQITAALTVDDALSVIKQKRFDVVIADYKLGEKSGAEFTRLVRGARDGSERFMPIIACTADPTSAVITDLRDAGADEILGKPVSQQSVADRINAVFLSRRKFVTSNNYFGPDRRRRATAPGKTERRSRR
jgi:two-component system, chemotaxis family, chemotaxis protein CheY